MNRTWVYTRSSHTDIRATFAKARQGFAVPTPLVSRLGGAA